MLWELVVRRGAEWSELSGGGDEWQVVWLRACSARGSGERASSGQRGAPLVVAVVDDGAVLGAAVGACVGTFVGDALGTAVGLVVGATEVGAAAGAALGATVGTSVGTCVGDVLGSAVGACVGVGVVGTGCAQCGE